MTPAVTIRRSVFFLAVIAAAACRTAQVPSAPAPSFFIQMSDPQFGMFTANNDFAQETVNFERAIAAANRLRPAFVVVTGDLTNAQGDSAQIAEYHRIIAQLDKSIPLYSVPGNHDVALPLSAASLAAYRRRYGPDRFTFESPGVHGIVINSSLIKEPLAVPEETAAQEAWLRTAVEQARARGTGRTIVFQHHSWFLSRAGELDQYFNLPLATRREYLDLFQGSGVRHVFAGHYHRNAYGRDGELEMVTTGPVGKPLGPDPSGFRIVTVDGDRVTHRYYGLDFIPERVSVDANITAFTNVSVIDGRDSVPRRDQTVIVHGDRIAASGAASAIRVPENARKIDGRGKFLIPGLWDMHVHTVTVSGRELLGLYVANGVTGVRDMASDWATIRQWRDEIAQGTLIGPRLVSSGPYLEGGDVPIAHILTRTPEEGRAGVDSLVAPGVDFVKVHGQLTPATYFTIARRARERGIAFAGHVARTVGSAAASDSGQRSIEHLLAIPTPRSFRLLHYEYHRGIHRVSPKM